MKTSKTEVLVAGDRGRVDGDFTLHGLGDVAVGEFNGRQVAVRANVPGAVFVRERTAPAKGKFMSTGWKADPQGLRESLEKLPQDVTDVVFLKDLPKDMRAHVAEATTRDRRNADEMLAGIGLDAAKRVQTIAASAKPAIERVTPAGGESFTQIPIRCRTQYVRDSGILVARVSRAQLAQALEMRLTDGKDVDFIAFNAGLDATDDAPITGVQAAPPQDAGE